MAPGLSPAPGSSRSGRTARVSASALRMLDWEDVLAGIERLAGSVEGAARVRALRPLAEHASVEEELLVVDEMMGLLLREEWTPPPIPEIRPALRRLGVEGSSLSAGELVGVARLLVSSRLARGDLRREPVALPRLAALGARLLREPDLERRLQAAFDDAGHVADAASPGLRRIRTAVRSARSAIVSRLEGFARALPERFQVPDASVTVRAGRYCVPIRREALGGVGGIVHDESATHRTVFVEPPQAIEPMNRLAELERSEAREVERILRELTDGVRPRAAALESSLEALAEADSLHARARWALAHGGTRPSVANPGAPRADRGLHLVAAHHPLLLAGGVPSVPFDLAMAEQETVLLVSGPNAGGKTVLLKTIGITCLLAQSGVIPPVGPGTRLPLFRSFHVVMGDEQSISASLSTFSAQVTGIRDALSEADADALVLLDEVGGGTDPAEGAALAAAVLVRFAERAGLSVATTHLGSLKALAEEDPRIVNASLSFDPAALRPTFRLRRDRPGRSYALEIAARLGLPEDLLARARGRLDGEERRVEDVLARLEARDADLVRQLSKAAALERRLAERERRLADEEGRLERRKAELIRREADLERQARTRVERLLAEARAGIAAEVARLREEFERALAAVEDAGEARERVRAAEAAARGGVERRLRETRAHVPGGQGDAHGAAAAGLAGAGVEPGAAARSRSLGVAGTVVERRGDRVVLEAGAVRVEVAAADLEITGVDPRASARRTPAAPLPDPGARPEVDLRGLRVEEVRPILERAVDAAVVADLPSLRVIHGKGTFALRDEVGRLLSVDGRVAGIRPGGFEEGGSGVTVVEFTREGD